MRFVSKSALYSAGNFRNAQEGIADPVTQVIDGKTVTTRSEAYVLTPAVPIQFNQRGLLQTDIAAALAHWKTFRGLPMEEDRVTPANPVEHGRIGVWDSVEWQAKYKLTDDDRERAEQMLLTSGRLGNEFIVIEEVKAAKPWPSYDETHHNKVSVLASELGLVNEALAYERENKNRSSVVEQLEASLAQVEEGEFVSA